MSIAPTFWMGIKQLFNKYVGFHNGIITLLVYKIIGLIAVQICL